MAGTARPAGAAILLAAALCGSATSAPAVEKSGRRAAVADLRSHVPAGRTGVSDDAKCQAYGFQSGTAGYADCRARLRQERAGKRRPAR
jgi:hypothetical protein